MTTQPFNKTPKQQEADALLKARPNLLYFMEEGGSRSGKTFDQVARIVVRALAAPGSRHAIWRQRFNAVRQSIMADTFPNVMRKRWPHVPWRVNKVDGIIELPGESQIWLGGLDSKERTEKVLGQEFATVYFNEISQIAYASVTMGLTRLAQSVMVPKLGRPLRLLALYDCNPPRKAHWGYQIFHGKKDPVTGRDLVGAEDYGVLKINPRDNPHLPPEYVKMLERLPPNERKRFLDGEYGDGVEGALWTWAHFKRAHPRMLPDMRRVVVAIDPPAKSGAKSAEAGIVVAGLGLDGRGYVLADGSTRGRPEEWARAAVNLYHAFGADLVVGEVNQGGDMVRAVVQSVDGNVPFKAVHATRGKVVRAEPIASLYAEDKVRHVGDFGELENQMVEFTTDFDVDVMGYSPDRVDGLVWALTELMLEPARGVSNAKVSGT